MSRFFSSRFSDLTPYTPGEQPQQRQYLKLNTNESPFPPSPFAQRLARQQAGDLQLYSDPKCRALVVIAAEILGVAEDELLFGNGSDEILNYAFTAFCDEAHPAAFADITYGFYPVFARFNRVPYTEIPLRNDFSVNVEDYLGIHKNIFLANPNAPTGIALSRREIERIVQANPDSVVVVDEAYVDFGAESALPLIHKYDNLLICQTLSKSRSLAGGRLGFAAGCSELICDLNTVKYSTNPYNVNRMTMYAGIGALEDSAYFEENCKKIIAAREWTQKHLKELGFTLTDSKANFLFAKHRSVGGKALYLALKDKGVLVRHFEKTHIQDHIRITVGSMEQMQRFITVLTEVLEEQK